MYESQIAVQKQHAFSRRMKFRMAVQIVLISLLPLALIVAVVGGRIWWFNFQERDAANSPLQTGTAVVTTMTQVNRRQGFRVNLTFRIDGRIAETSVLINTNMEEDERFIWTHVGDTVPVTYRVGKSGAVYIDSWQAPPHKVSLSR